MSRTAVYSDVTIVDNIIRCLPLMVEYAREMKDTPHDELLKIVENFDNETNLADSMELMKTHLEDLSKDMGPLRQKKPSGAKA